jgi:hypothetical protein
MRGKVAALIAAVLIVFCVPLMFIVQRAHAESSPPDDCWTMQIEGLGGYACEHIFSDGSKCIVFKGANPRGLPWTSNMECKIH